MRLWRNSGGLGPALGLALLLALQLVFAGFALGAGASAPPLDAYGNPICAPGAAEAGHGGGGHGQIPPCCQLGCPVAGNAALPPDAAGLQAPRPVSLCAGRHVARAYAAEGKDPWRPNNPRAPPA